MKNPPPQILQSILRLFSIVIISLSIHNNCFGEYQPPLGIPYPSFGMDETVAGIYGSDSYYTHYVDNTSTNPTCTDTSNPKGSAAKPRCTLPSGRGLAAGSVIEIHGGPYSTSSMGYVGSSGTASQPIFFRGKGNVRPVINTTLRVRGAYIIFEEIDFNFGGQRQTIDIRPDPADPVDNVHHIALRNCEVHNFSAVAAGSTSLIGVSGQEGTSNYVHDVLFYNNNIHSDTMAAYTTPNITEYDIMGVSTSGITHHIWILDNDIHHNAGDGIGNGHEANMTATFYYIGRNKIHDNGENAIDLKEVEHFVVSQNTMYEHHGESAGDGGTAVVLHYGKHGASARDIWLLSNEIYNATDTGIQIGGSGALNKVDQIYCIGNTIHDIHNELGKALGFTTWGSDRIYVIGNDVYNTDQDLDFSGGSGTVSAAYVINNTFNSLQNPSGYHLALGSTDYLNRSVITTNLFYQKDGSVRIPVGYSVYDVAGYQQKTGKCAGCIEAKTSTLAADLNDFRTQRADPTKTDSFESGVYAQYKATFGVDIEGYFKSLPVKTNKPRAPMLMAQ